MSKPSLHDIDWERHFSLRALNLAEELAFQGRVLGLQALDDSGLAWRAEVQGSRRKPYVSEARLTAGGGAPRGRHRLASTCSCPIGANCKHVAAMLFAAQKAEAADETFDATPGLVPQLGVVVARTAATPAPAVDPLAAWEQWLQQLAPSAQAGQAAAAPQHFGLLLRASAGDQPRRLLAAMAVWTEGKRGGWIKPKAVTLEHGLLRPSPPGGWPQVDVMALTLLVQRQLHREGALPYALLEEPPVQTAFAHLASRHRLYWERADQPIELGPPRRLAAAWFDEPDGSQRLGWVAADGAPLELLRGDGFWYRDASAARIGRVEDAATLLAAIRRAPRLLPEASAALRRRLQSQGGPVALPLPIERAAPRVLRVAPRAKLRLRLADASPHFESRLRGRERHAVATPEFVYGDEVLAAHGADRVRRLRAGEVIEIVRDLRFEREVLERWREKGLLPAAALPWPLSEYLEGVAPDDLLLVREPRRPPAGASAWQPLLRELREEGVLIEYAKGFPRPLREIDAGEWEAELAEGASGWFDLSLGIIVEGERHDLLPILRRVLGDPRFPLSPAEGEPADATWRVELDDERALRLPLARLRGLLAPLLDWLQQGAALRLHRSQAATLRELSENVRWRGDESLRRRLVDLSRRPTAALAPPGLHGTLRAYQAEGLAWLDLLDEAGLGGVLADDMGLGKTLQVLAHLLSLRARGRPHRTLVVAPTSLMGNWRDEAARFAPDLGVLVLQGPGRGGRFEEIGRQDLVLTTYPLLARDRERLLAHEFDLLVLDEAQAIKNARSQAAGVVRELRARRRLAMTGTPLENHLGELWAQFDAVEPGLLGSERAFARLYRSPIEKHGDEATRRRLERRIGPLMLRRRKDEVLAELPPKTEIVQHIELEGGQRELYESLRLAQHQRVQQAVAERGLAQSGIVVLDALLKLRQVCCDPRLLSLPSARNLLQSAKLEALLELLTTLLDEGRRVLLFSQFTGMLDLIEQALDAAGIGRLRLDGSTPGAARAGIVRRFQDGDQPLFLISLKAGGTGLNLTTADAVIHYDPWWNPAVEAQATDRAHRIGQDKPVFVYKLICTDTVEDKILALQRRKADLAAAVLEGGRSTQPRFAAEDIAELFAPLG